MRASHFIPRLTIFGERDRGQNKVCLHKHLKNHPFSRIVIFLSILGAMTTLSLMLYTAKPWTTNFHLDWVMVSFILWALLPYPALSLPMIFVSLSKRALVVYMVFASIAVLGGLFFYFDAMFVHLDPQSAIVFVFIPLYQLAGVIVILWTIVMTGFRKQSDERTLTQ